MNTLLKFPVYAKVSLLLIGLYLVINMLFIAQDIVLPLMYGTIIAISLSPAVNFLVKKRFNRALAIALVLLVTILVIGALIGFLSAQASLLSESWPQLTKKFQELLNQSTASLSQYFDISLRKINTWLDHAKTDLLNNSNAAIGITLTTMGGVLAAAFLTPVYVFMVLFYQPHLVKFVHQIFGADNDSNVNEILSETKTIIQSYLVGLFIEFIIVAVLNSLGLMLLGMEYAILLGIIGALLNVIPYLGGAIVVVLYALIALATKSPVYILYVIGLYTFIQLIDNNYIVPKIVGSKVKLNALVSLIAVILGAALWGIPGMFLSIPLLAIIKLILDRIEPLKPWGFLLGDTMPPLVKLDIDLKEITKIIPKVTLPFRKQTPPK